MKRNTPEHWKTEMLQLELNIGLAQAVGHLELLFNTTAKHTPHGDIGKMPDAIIAKRCGWAGEPQIFINALVKCRWLDECTVSRLTVHDWDEHCDDSTRKQVIRSKTPFKVAVRTTADNVQTCPDNGGQNLPTMPNQALPSQALPSQTKPDFSSPTITFQRDDCGLVDSATERVAGDDVFQSLPPVLGTEAFKAEWLLWEKYLKGMHRTLQPMQRLPSWLNLLERAPPGGEVAFGITTIRQAIAAGWKNLYPKEERKDGSHGKPKSAPGGGRIEGLDAPSIKF